MLFGFISVAFGCFFNSMWNLFADHTALHPHPNTVPASFFFTEHRAAIPLKQMATPATNSDPALSPGGCCLTSIPLVSQKKVLPHNTMS